MPLDLQNFRRRLRLWRLSATLLRISFVIYWQGEWLASHRIDLIFWALFDQAKSAIEKQKFRTKQNTA